MKQYDVVVIGGGPGGYTAAAELAAHKLKVALIEKDSFGGVCVNYGCIPTKALLSSANKLNHLKHFNDFGILGDYKNVKLDIKQMQGFRKILRDRLNSVIKVALVESHAEIYQGEAEVIDDKTVKVNGEVFGYSKLVLATGSRNRFLNLEGFEKAKAANVLGDSDYFLFLEDLPKSLIIIGGGPISVEFAYLYATLGVKVTIVQDMPTLAPQFDRDAIAVFTQTLQSLGVTVITSTKIKKLTNDYTLEFEHEGQQKQLKADKYLLSVGRVLNDESFKNLNLKKDERNRLILNEKLQTSLPHIFAIGDITSQIQLTNVAYVHSSIVTRVILNQPFRPLRMSNVPYALYISPEIAAVGASEQMLEKTRPDEYYVINLPAASMPRNQAEKTAEYGFFKILVDKKTNKILGAHIALENASIIINELALAMTADLTIYDLLATAHTHPTLSEAIFYAVRGLTSEIK